MVDTAVSDSAVSLSHRSVNMYLSNIVLSYFNKLQENVSKNVFYVEAQEFEDISR